VSKLFKLSQWLTIEETADHLSSELSELITEAKVLQLGIDGHLKLSIDFYYSADAKKAEIITIDKASDYDVNFSRLLFQDLGECGAIFSTKIDAQTIVKFNDVTTISGVFDLPFIGGERLAVIYERQRIIKGADVQRINYFGIYVTSECGELYQLQGRAGVGGIKGGTISDKRSIFLPSTSELVVRKVIITEFLNSLKVETNLMKNNTPVPVINNSVDEGIKVFIMSVLVSHPKATSKDIIGHCFSCYKGNNSRLEPIKKIIAKLNVVMGGDGRRTDKAIKYMEEAPRYKPTH